MNRLLLFLCFLLPHYSNAQSYIDAYPPVTLPNTEVHTLHSNNNDQTYKLYVALPVNYDASPDKKFPVLYTLDADYSFAIVKNISDHLNERNNLEGIIIVGIAYSGPNQYRVNRTRDYTPHYSAQGGYGPEYQRHSGGGPKFLKFLEEELFPYIGKNYRINGTRALSGHSYGGLFASWLLVTKPATFQKYIIVSPSLWYDHNFLFTKENETYKQNATVPAEAYLSVGALEENMAADLTNFVKQIEGHRYPRLKLGWSVQEGENHNTVYPIALTKALRFLFPNQ